MNSNSIAAVPLFVYALDMEVAELRDQSRAIPSAVDPPPSVRLEWRIMGGSRFALLPCGIGLESSEKRLRPALQSSSFSVVVSTGFCGGTRSAQVVGDIFIVHGIKRYHGSLEADEPSGECEVLGRVSESLLQRTHSDLSSLPSLRGGGELLSLMEPAIRPVQKRLLGEQFEVDIVDMETASIFKVSEESNIPFVGVRVVSDRMEDDLRSPFFRLIARHEALQKALLGISRTPWQGDLSKDGFILRLPTALSNLYDAQRLLIASWSPTEVA